MSDTNGTPKGIHAVHVEVEHLHRLRVADVLLQPGGGLVRVTGKNGHGKTSFLRTIREAIGGAGEVSDVPVNDESEDGTGKVTLELTNGFTITRSFTEANTKGYLTVVGPDGGRHGQTKVTGWLGPHHSFDLMALFDLKPERQREILLSLASDPDLQEKLAVAKSAWQSLYDQRTPHIAEKRRAAQILKDPPAGDRPEPVDTSAETKRVAHLQAAQRERQDLERAVSDIESRQEKKHNERVRQDREIERLERELEAARDTALRLEREADALEVDRVAAVEAVAAAPDVEDELAAVMQRLEDASAIEAALAPWRRHDEAQAALQAATAEVRRLTSDMAVAEEDERRLLADAGIPVEGLTFDRDSGEPLLNGRPLSVASGGERIRMAVAVAVAADPELRICLVDEANDLDLDALEELDALAREHDFQVIACRIGLEGVGHVVVEDGEARTGEPAVAAS